jgi:hypothetical protein
MANANAEGTTSSSSATLRILTVVCLVVIGSRASAEDKSLGYRHDILPILSDRCFKCHGPDSAARKAGLRLDQEKAAKSELESGETAIVPGNTAKSKLIERITSTAADVMMPPPDSGKVLSAAEKDLLRRWIEQGAKYQPHWAFEAPVRPPVPQVTHAKLVHNPIDAFVLARLEREKLEPSSPATKERLVRRLSFDLTGLPPSLQEVDAFVADNSPQAYDHVVDRLMQSPQYGECMAGDWLDGARYADSNGYQNDFTRNMSPWRDWVIDAFNHRMSYNQFVTEQIAGDLLPHPTLEQRIATGFNRNHRTVTECGSIEDEWFVENVVDRVETMGTVMLGLTIGCARCHDHKFDPITQREFYQLFAFFDNVNERGVYKETRGNVPPLEKAMTPDRVKRLAEYDAKIAELSNQLGDRIAGIASHRQEWLDSFARQPPTKEPEAVASISLRPDETAHIAETKRSIAAATQSRQPKFQRDLFGKVPEFRGNKHLDYVGLDFPPADKAFSWAVWVKPAGDGALLSKMDDLNAFRGCDLIMFPDHTIGMHIIANWPGNALKVRTNRPLPQGDWSHIIATYDGSRKAAGIALYVNGTKQEVTVESDTLNGSFANEQPFRVGMRSIGSALNGAIADVRLFDHSLTNDEAQTVLQGSLQRELGGVKLALLEKPQLGQIDKLLLATSKDEFAAKLLPMQQSLKIAQDERAKLDDSIPTTMIMEERKQPRDTYVLKRGRYDQPDKDQKVMADVPAVFPRLPEGAPRNRLGLAKWLASPQNPLTARVIVNRLWQRFFGIGLVKTSENFGVQSEPPSNPELLDWLATELVQSGWNLQHIQRLIVSSYAYQQRSETSPELYKRDPDNRLVARGPRQRLPAEAVRDNALAVSGLLVNKIGGPSVMPYQPVGLWEELAGGAHDDYTQAHGDDLYRRSLYIFRKRTVPHPSMATFDAPSWEMCQVRRASTDTPLQALALLNDVTYVEAARKFAERMLTEGGGTADLRITFAFRLATGRSPSADELHVLRSSLEKYTARFRQSPASASDFVSHGESPRNKSLDVVDLAAHTAMASVLLNMDETISKN